MQLREKDALHLIGQLRRPQNKCSYLLGKNYLVLKYTLSMPSSGWDQDAYNNYIISPSYIVTRLQTQVTDRGEGDGANLLVYGTSLQFTAAK